MSISTGKGPPVWALDVDGVFARFNEGALAWLNKNFRPERDQLQFPDPAGPTSWNWPREIFGRKVENAFWEMVQKNPHWWVSLGIYESTRAFLDDIDRRQQAGRVVPYFVTSRPPNDAQQWTRFWLDANGMTNPMVVVVQPGKKHLVLEALGAQVLVDDYVENFRYLPSFTRGYLVDRPWNRGLEQSGVLRVQSPLDVFVHEAKYASGLLEGHR